MKTSLKGLLTQAGQTCERGDKTYGALFAYSLMELGDHIRELLRGEHTAEEFATHYCNDLGDKKSWADPDPSTATK
jgi:hypothetical protein